MKYTRKPRARSTARARSATRLSTSYASSLVALAEARARHRSDVLKLATAAALGTALLVSSAGVLAQAAQPTTAETIRYVKGRILVQPRAGLSDKELDKILSAHGGKREKHIKQINLHIVELPPQANEVAVAQALAKNPHVKFAELDRVVELAASTNDPSLSSEWHIPKIQAPTAWDYSGGAGVTIAVLDTGVDGTHPDLAAAMVPGWNAYDGNTDTRDVQGHGTKAAGTAAAIGNNTQGVAGVAWQAKIMPVRIADANAYAYWSTMANGITWAADHGARVANLSYQNSCGSSTVTSAAQYMRNKGGVVVISAGNTGGAITDAQSASVTCVSATDSNDARTSWSSYGAAIDVAAPGAGILTTVMGGSYGSVSGTSFSAPITAGIYALMMAANKTLTPTQLDSILLSTAKDLGTSGYDTYYGYGRVDAAAAVNKARSTVASDSTPPTVSISSPSGGSKVSGLVAVNVSAADNVGVTKVDLYANNALVASDAVSPFGFSWNTSGLGDGPVTLTAKAYDAAGNITTSSGVGVTVANDTQPPTVSISNPANGSTVTGTVSVSVTAQDNVKVSKITLTIDGKQVAIAYGSSMTYSWNTGSTGSGKGKNKNQTSTGTSSISAKAEDPAGNAATSSVTVNKQ